MLDMFIYTRKGKKNTGRAATPADKIINEKIVSHVYFFKVINSNCLLMIDCKYI